MGGRFASIILPRLVAVVWSAWAYSTAYAYIDGPPPTLESTQAYLVIPIWAIWATSATLALGGALVPPARRLWIQHAGSILRGTGIAVMAGLLTLWGIEFITGEMDRGWVSGKNYWLLATCALAACWYVGQGGTRASPREANEDD